MLAKTGLRRFGFLPIAKKASEKSKNTSPEKLIFILN